MNFRIAAISLVITIAATPPAAAAEDEIVMRLPPADTALDPQVIGGRIASVTDWPATLIFQIAGKGVCTSTVVGNRVILTAAHCIPNGAKGKVDVGATPVTISCEHHPSYTPNDKDQSLTTSADWALCAASQDIPVSAFESISNKGPAANDELLLLGYGCNKKGGTDGGFGFLFEGEAKVMKLPDAGGKLWKLNYVETSGGAAVCFGDSGGAAYRYLDRAKRSRVLVGVNSRGDIAERSYISATYTPSFTAWAVEWSKNKKVAICGLHGDIGRCHE